jgi:hypothetical protein
VGAGAGFGTADFESAGFDSAGLGLAGFGLAGFDLADFDLEEDERFRLDAGAATASVAVRARTIANHRPLMAYLHRRRSLSSGGCSAAPHP